MYFHVAVNFQRDAEQIIRHDRETATFISFPACLCFARINAIVENELK